MTGLPSSTSTEIEEKRLSFRDAMAYVGAAANIVTSNGSAGRVGFSATAVAA